MKNRKHSTMHFVLTLIVMTIASQVSAQEVSLKLYGIESGIIEYKYSGSKVGKGIMYFDDYGNKCAMNEDTKRGEKVNKGWVISLGAYQYIFDPSKPNEGLKLINPIIEWVQQTNQKDVEKFTEEMYSKMGIVKAGTEKFLDKDCIVYKGDMGKVLTWNGILMLTDMNYEGIKSRQEVTSIKVNIPVDEKYFEIPTNIKFSDMPFFGTEGDEEEEEDSGDEDEE